MNIKEIIQKDMGILVSNQKDYDNLTRVLHDMGLTWNSGKSYLNGLQYFNFSRHGTYIFPKDGTFLEVGSSPRHEREIEYISFTSLMRDDVINDILKEF